MDDDVSNLDVNPRTMTSQAAAAAPSVGRGRWRVIDVEWMDRGPRGARTTASFSRHSNVNHGKRRRRTTNNVKCTPRVRTVSLIWGWKFDSSNYSRLRFDWAEWFVVGCSSRYRSSGQCSRSGNVISGPSKQGLCLMSTLQWRVLKTESGGSSDKGSYHHGPLGRRLRPRRRGSPMTPIDHSWEWQQPIWSVCWTRGAVEIKRMKGRRQRRVCACA